MNRNKYFLILLHAGFFLIGILTVLLGQILPIISTRLSLNDYQSGYFFLAQFSGSLLGNFSYNQITKKFGHRAMLLIGFCLMSVGSFGLNLSSLPMGIISVFLYGIGIGLTIPAINLLVIELNFEKSASASNIINFFWGVGAILSKPFVDFVGSKDNFLLPTVLLAVGLATIGLSIWFLNHQVTLATPEKESTIIQGIWKSKIAWLIAIFNFVHIGIESSLGSWITTFENRLTQFSSTGLISSAFVFFLCLVLGRGIVPVFFRYFSGNVVLLFSLLIMTGGVIIIILAENFFGLIIGAGVVGIGSSSVFPTNMARFTTIFGEESTRNAAPLFVFGGLGGAFITWFIGFISSSFDSLRAGFVVILASCLFLVFLQIILINVAPIDSSKKIE